MASDPSGPAPARHVVLVGMMAVGKTTVGQALAERLGRPFLDSDQMVEQRTGRTVREIFEAEGEPAYRLLETAVLVEALASPEPAVIAAAGGVVLAAANRAALKAPGPTVIWLRAPVEVLAQRVATAGGPGHRPLLDGDAPTALARLAEAREPLYREVADVVVDVDALGPDTVLARVLAALAPSEA